MNHWIVEFRNEVDEDLLNRLGIWAVRLSNSMPIVKAIADEQQISILQKSPDVLQVCTDCECITC